MAFDGITIANIVSELNQEVLGGRIYKIAQPENDELLLTIKNGQVRHEEGEKVDNGTRRLLISSSASLPLLYLTSQNKPSPLSAPGFCMLLRKHLQNARIVAIRQIGLERVVEIDMEHLNEMGDLCTKTLIIEIMGKHSNIIFVDEKRTIIDSIKHISSAVSSVREVLPGRTYFLPVTQEKLNPFDTDYTAFSNAISEKAMPLFKSIYSTYTGISPLIANEIAYRAKQDADLSTKALSDGDMRKLYEVFVTAMSCVTSHEFVPQIVYENEAPIEYASIPLTIYPDACKRSFGTVSELLENYYAQKNAVTRIRQKSVDLRKIVSNALERNVKKYDLQLLQMKDTIKRDKYKVYGELINTYGYQVESGAKSMTALNYYTNEDITIPLDPTLTTSENAQKYFEKYNKLKRTYEALSELTVTVKTEIDHLESIQTALDIAMLEEDLTQIKEELIESGYIRRKGNTKKPKITSKPFHYISQDGYDIYIGKNNYQNDELTFKLATGNDWWFHVKGAPGSHVVVKANNEELPDTTFEDAARLAAYYSKCRTGQNGSANDRIEIDYLQKKNVKKPNGAKPGFVVYYTNYSMVIDSDISKIKQME